ncbi:MAG: peptide chain release factor N(5)-glutamine methyltransferase [Thainema sp.]
MSNSDSEFQHPSLLDQGWVHSIEGSALFQWRRQARQSAIAFDIPATELDWLLTSVTALDRLALRLGSDAQQPEIKAKVSLVELEQIWQQRVEQRMPLQYLIGSAPWRNFELVVSPAVLIPRPETESIIDLAISAIQQTELANPEQGHWADLGTGSGAIALGLAEAMPDAHIHAVDYSREALAIAQLNAERYKLRSRIQFYQGSWFEPLVHLQGQFTAILSNPPYIPSQTVLTLQAEVVEHEPHLALDGGQDGLDCIRHIVKTAALYLKPGGLLLFEIMAGQGEDVAQILQQSEGFTTVQIHPDYAGLDRFALAYRR